MKEVHAYRHFRTLSREHIFTVMRHKHNNYETVMHSFISVAQKPFQTLGHIFAKPKDPVTKEQRTDAIYSIPCNDCDNEYIGRPNVSLAHG